MTIAIGLLACGLEPLRLLDDERAALTPPIALRRCDQARDVLCVLTFGLEPPDQMLILLLASPGLPEKLEAVVIHDGSELSYVCASPDAGSTTLSCSGPLLPLGAHLRIEVYSRQPDALLAGGDFSLIALAWPTMSDGGPVLATQPPSATDRPTRTPLRTTTARPPSATEILVIQTPARGPASPAP